MIFLMPHPGLPNCVHIWSALFHIRLQALPAIRENVDMVSELFQDTVQLLGAMHSLLSIICPEKKVSK